MSDGQRKIINYAKDGPDSGAAGEAPKEKSKPTKRKLKIDTHEEDTDSTLDNATAASATLNSGDFIESVSNENYEFPSIDLLQRKRTNITGETPQSLQEKAMKLEDTLRSFNIDATVTNVTQGPAVTRYEVHPNSGVKVKGIKSLADDIALNMEAKSIRMEAPIPGKAAVGIEVENESREMVCISEIISSQEFKKHPSKLAFAVGKDIGGAPVVADLAKMPHMLIAGATGSG